ncbi:MAG: contact-dependent growth inhibition system immunity protein [Chthoniobacter sp.]
MMPTASSFDRNKSLQQLEGDDWGEPNFDSHPVIECHRLRRVPLGEFTVENLRIMIGQKIGLEYLLPLALERLEENPFAEGDCYPCDLLENVLGCDARFWQQHAAWRQRIAAIAERAISLFPAMPDLVDADITKAVTNAYEEFQQRRTTAA